MNLGFVPGKDLHSWNVIPLQFISFIFLLHEMLNITTDIWSCSNELYHINNLVEAHCYGKDMAGQFLSEHVAVKQFEGKTFQPRRSSSVL